MLKNQQFCRKNRTLARVLEALLLAVAALLCLHATAPGALADDPPPSVKDAQADGEKKTPGQLTVQDLYRSQVPDAARTELGLATPSKSDSLLLIGAPAKGPQVFEGDRPVYYFFDRLFVFIGGHAATEMLKNGSGPTIVAGIDSTVHNPWLLNNSTAKWRDQFEYNALRINSSVIATMLPGMAVYSPERARRDPALSPYTADDAFGIAKTVATRIAGDIQPDAAIDYGVHKISALPFFPKTVDGWHSVERKIGDTGLPLVLTALAIGGAANLGAISLGGDAALFHDKEYALGWRASVRHFGFSMTPDLRAGPAFTTTKGVELNSSIVRHVNAADGTEKTGIDVFAKVPIIRPSGNHWDVGIISNGHYFLVDDNPKEHGQFRLSTDIYFKTSDLLNQGRINQFVGDLNYTTNFKTQSAATLSLGLSDFNTETTLSIFARVSRDSLDASGNASVFGMFVNGSLESQTPMLKGRMMGDGRRVQRALDEFRKMKIQVEYCHAHPKPAPAPGEYAPFANALEAQKAYEANLRSMDCLADVEKLEAARKTLQREFTLFLEVRTNYFMHQGHESRNAITDWDGPFEPSLMKEIRKAIGLPEYEAANLGEVALVRPETVDAVMTVKPLPGQAPPARGPAATPGKTPAH